MWVGCVIWTPQESETIFMYKALNGQVPSYISDIIPPHIRETTNYSLRNRDNITVPFYRIELFRNSCIKKRVREKSRECHNHKPQPLPDPKRKRKPTNPNKHKSNKRTKSTKICSLFPKRGNRNTKKTEKHKNKMTHGKTYNKSPRRINHKATKSKTNTGTTALERPVE